MQQQQPNGPQNNYPPYGGQGGYPQNGYNQGGYNNPDGYNNNGGFNPNNF